MSEAKKKKEDEVEKAKAAVDAGVTSKETLYQALNSLFTMRDKIAIFTKRLNQARELEHALAEMTGKYVKSSKLALENEVRYEDGTFSGDLLSEDEKTVYHLNYGVNGIKRTEKGVMEQDYLAGLPADWTVSKLSLDVTGINRAGVKDEALREYGLARRFAYKWSADAS